MRKSFTSATPNGQKTKTDIWLTPEWLIKKIGVSDLDPCGYLPNGSPIIETANKYFTEEENGLIQEWEGVVFVNFPYSQSREWLDKCKIEYFKNKCEIIVLCFARTETRAWQENVKSATGINFINKRIKFLDKNGVEHTNGNSPSCLIAFGENAYKRISNVDGILTRIDK